MKSAEKQFRAMKSILFFVTSVVLFCSPILLVYACGQPAALTIAEVQGVDTVVKDGCREVGSMVDASSLTQAETDVLVACQFLPDKSKPDSGIVTRYYAVKRSEWNKVDASK